MGEPTVITPKINLGAGGTTYNQPHVDPVPGNSNFWIGGEMDIDHHPTSHYSFGGSVFADILTPLDTSVHFGVKPFFSVNLPYSFDSDILAGLKIGFPLGARYVGKDSLRFTGGINLEAMLINSISPIGDSETWKWSPGYLSASFSYLKTPAFGISEDTFLIGLKMGFFGLFTGGE